MSDSDNKRLARLPVLQHLADLPVGGVARLSCEELPEGEQLCPLAAMGMTEGCRLKVRTSGDPCIVEVRSTRIGLARSVAVRLVVASDAADAGASAAASSPEAK
ncbi:MAG: ferrous iron transport protein A [Betaproteobacteria bacterium]|nr:ferrous iron transport protein A [Betaproteobacteria bacterium]